MNRLIKQLVVFIPLLIGASIASAEEKTPALRIPKVARPPKLEDFINNTPREAEIIAADFRQFDPGDGDPVSRHTIAYLSYDDKNLYVAFVCKDDPAEIRNWKITAALLLPSALYKSGS